MDKLIEAIIRKKLLKEAKATGTDAISNTAEAMAKAVWEQGYAALRDVFASRVELPKGITTHVVPVPAIGTALTAEPAAGDVTFIGMTYKNVVADLVRGLNYGWDRSYLESCAWSALEPQLKGAGEAIERSVFKAGYDHLVADCDAGNKAEYANGAAFTYADFLAGVALVAGDDYEADICILPPDLYFELLNDQKFIDASYMGSADPIRTGKIQTTLGVTVFMSTVATAGTALFFDSKKACCMAVIRDRQTEEYSYPDSNLYGLVMTMKFGFEVVLPKAIALLTEAAP